MLAQDQRKLFMDKSQIDNRRQLLDLPHIAPLKRYAENLRKSDLGEIPDFDPLDGGINAKALFLMEKPGPKAFVSGFISRDNNDETAAATFDFMLKANIPRDLSVLWNVIPGWDRKREFSSDDLRKGAVHLNGLIALLPKLRVIFCVGKTAQKAFAKSDSTFNPVLTSIHPSPINRARRPKEWSNIWMQWAKALSYIMD